MSRSIRPSSAAVALIVMAAAPVLRAGCPQPIWSDGSAAGIKGPVYGFHVASIPASEPSLFVGGSFNQVGFISAENIAQWTGSAWMQLATGVNGSVRAMTTFDPDGDGPLPPALVVGGEFTSAGTMPALRIALWNGSTWSPLGAGFNARVNALAVFDEDDDGPASPALYAGGVFSGSGAATVAGIARWNGHAWLPVGGGASNEVLGLASIDLDGAGPETSSLIVGGWFTQVGTTPASRIARWNGIEWSTFGNGFAGPFPVYTRSFVMFDHDGPGLAQPSLHVAGFFRASGTQEMLGLARWDGSTWLPVGGGIGYPAEARALVVLDDDGDGPAPESLFAAGSFLPLVGGPGNNIARWDGNTWATLTTGTDQGINALAVFQDKSDVPPALFIGGSFSTAGDISALNFARWGCAPAIDPNCPDPNNDGEVNFSDITIVLTNWGAVYDEPPAGLLRGPGDSNADGVVNFADITAVLMAWGTICP